MRTKKANTFPEYKNLPPPPEPKKERNETPEETLADVLTAIQNHPPNYQHWIIGEILKETAICRHGEMMVRREAVIQAEGLIKEFIELQQIGQRTLNSKTETEKGR